MKAAITGANGLVGTNLARKLSEKGYEVKALFYNTANSLKGLKITKTKGDIRDKKFLDTFLKDVDVVFHAAAIISISGLTYKELYETNVEGTKNVFNVAKRNGVKVFVHFSSIHALKQNNGNRQCSEKCVLNINSSFLYERTKALAQKWLTEQKGNGMKVVILNPTAIIGPNDYKPSLVGEFIIKTVTRKLPALMKGGYNWVDVRDVVEASVNAVEKGKDGENYILSGRWESLTNITKILEKITGDRFKTVVIPYWLALFALPLFFLWAKLTKSTPLYTYESLKIIRDNNRNINSQKASTELGFNPCPLEQTLKETYFWFKENNFLQ
jgi:dihydroflavonol-4-reductase